MKFATIRLGWRTTAVRVEADFLVDLGRPDVGALLAAAGGLPAAATVATRASHPSTFMPATPE